VFYFYVNKSKILINKELLSNTFLLAKQFKFLSGFFEVRTIKKALDFERRLGIRKIDLESYKIFTV